MLSVSQWRHESLAGSRVRCFSSTPLLRQSLIAPGRRFVPIPRMLRWLFRLPLHRVMKHQHISST